MTTKTVTIAIDEGDLGNAQRAAKAAGVSFSAYAARAIHAQWLRDQTRRYQEALSRRNTAEAAERDAWLDANAARLAQRAQ